MLKSKLYTFFILLLAFSAKAQEAIFPLNGNSVLQNIDFKNTKAESSFTQKSATAFGDTLLLPINEDFSYSNPYPTNKYWLDSNVYINTSMAAKPPTWGVATFDGLNKKGDPYNPNVTNAYGIADYLTSKPIFLDYAVADSIYFSFYFQPQGYGNNPQPEDSLILEFRAPGTSWTKIWYANGTPIPADSSFKKVMIAIKTPNYLQKGFQFRFKNYATLSGFLDHWNIDYIDLRRFRAYNDIYSDDVAFMSTTLTFLKDYKAVPYKQYTTSMMNNTVKNEIVNLHSTVKNTSYNFLVNDKDGNQVYAYNGGNINIEPFSTNGIHNYAPHATPIFDFSFPENGKCSEYIITHIVRAVPDVNRHNDTLRVKVQLTDYFAYDDGSAEAAYGITEVNGMMAYKFEVTKQDTLNGVWIYFNPFINNVSVFNFNLIAWDANSEGKPNIPISYNALPSNPLNNGYINGFWYYAFENPVIVNGTFFVGFKQQSAQTLNIGIDKHSKINDKMYFNIDGNWNLSQFNYPWMMRPSFGNCNGFSMDIDKKEVENNKLTFSVYPNPAQNYFSIQSIEDIQIEKIELINQIGITVREYVLPQQNEKLETTELPNGIYFVHIYSKKTTQRSKLIIQSN